MPRPLRRDLPDGIYHVTARGVARGPVFLDDVDRTTFLRLLDQSMERYTWRCHAFCLMDNHYHLIVQAARAKLSSGLHRLNGVYAQIFNRRYGRTGHLFGDRFASWLIENERHLAQACRYVVQNPVRAGLCAHPAEWRWSGPQRYKR